VDNDVAFKINETELFDGIEFAEIEPLLETILLKHGDTLCEAGDPADRMWVIAEGKIRIGGRNGNGDIPVIRYVGDVVGEQSVFGTDGKHSETMTAAWPARLISIPSKALEMSNPKVRERLLVNLARILSRKLSDMRKTNSEHLRKSDEAKSMLGRLVNPDGFDLETGNLRNGFTFVEAVIWFSDVVDFTKIAENASAAEIGEMICEVMSIQSDAIARHNGFVDKFQGDGIMAYWPVSSLKADIRRDAARWALEAAEESVKAIRTVVDPSDRRRKLDIRVGLHLGKDNVIRGNFGSNDRFQWTLIGSDVNRAAAIEQAKNSALGSIRMSKQFRSCLDDDTATAYAKQAKIETKSGRIDVYSN
jgi:class 3 adenylate cyclase